MDAILVRVGVDNSYGGWNAPVDPNTCEFVYVPIPENEGTEFHSGGRRAYAELEPALETFGSSNGRSKRVELPAQLQGAAMHLDPDFEALTYGDVGDRRGSGISRMNTGDLVVFYAGMEPISPCEHKLIYALTGILTVDQVVHAADVEQSRWNENAHTRKIKRGASDIVVRAQPGVSGRFETCIPIGEFRNRSYRVRNDILDEWGGLSVKDGYIQRSAVPPRFLEPKRFSNWLDAQAPTLLQSNW